MKIKSLLTLSTSALLATACVFDGEDKDTPDTAPETQEISVGLYAFNSKLAGHENMSSVSYSGQVARQLLIDELKSYIGTADSASPLDLAILNEYYAGVGGEEVTTERPITVYTNSINQTKISEVNASKNLKNKNGVKPSPVQVVLSDANPWNGWTADSIIQDIFTNHIAGATSAIDATSKVDMAQLTQKILHGSVSYNQAVNHYLVIENADNIAPKGDGAAYTELEHIIDEAFGYFGAAKNYHILSDAEIKGGIYKDIDQVAGFDLKTEVNFGISINAAKRDAGSSDVFNFTKAMYDAFYKLRYYAANNGTINDMQAQVEIIKSNWEMVLASTAIHYVNEVVVDINALGDGVALSPDVITADHSKHWSELKGFAIALQFNATNSWTAAEHKQLQTLIGLTPYGTTKANLLEARTLLASKFSGFTDAIVAAW